MISIFIILICSVYTFHASEHTNYQTFIHEQGQLWIDNYLHQFSQKHEKELLIDIILLSYQITQESCIMMHSKFIAHQELINLHTPSLTDSWHVNLQVIKNDTHQLLQAITNFNQAQQHIEQIVETFRSFGPKIIQIDPQPTQTLINDLKQALMIWGKQQHDLKEELCILEEEFILASNAIADAKQMLQLLEFAKEFKHSHLKQAAGYVTKTNKDLTQVFAHINKIHIDNIIKIQQFFAYFFKSYFQLLYQHLNIDEQQNLRTNALGHTIIPNPEYLNSPNLTL